MSENLVNIYEKKAEEMTAIHMITAKDKFEETEGGFVSLDYIRKRARKRRKRDRNHRGYE